MLICLSNSLLVSFDHNIHSTFCLLSPFHVSRCCWHPNDVNNRMMTRAFGHNPCCDNQSSNVVLRGEIYLRLSWQTSTGFPRRLWFLLYFLNKGKSRVTSGFLYFVIFHIQMIQSLLEEHSQAMMLKHYPTKHLLPPLNQHSAMGPFVFFFRGEEEGALRCAGHVGRLTVGQVISHISSNHPKRNVFSHSK